MWRKLIGFALTFASPLVVVRVLNTTDFRLFKQAALLLQTALPVLTFGFDMNAFYFLPRRPAQAPKIVLNILIVHACVALAAASAVLLYPQVLEQTSGADLAQYARLLATLLGVSILGFFLEVVATANQDVAYSTAFIISASLTRGFRWALRCSGTQPRRMCICTPSLASSPPRSLPSIP